MNIKKFIPFVLCFALLSCRDVKYDYHTGDTSRIPSNLKKVSYKDLPGWTEDDQRYALQAFRNSCKAKIQYAGAVRPDKALFDEKCKTMPGANASNSTVRKWFEDNFQPYQLRNDDGTTKGVHTGYYSPVIPACKTKTAECNEPLMGVPTDGRGYKGVDKKTIVNNKIGKVLYWANIVDVQNIQIQGSGMLKLKENGELVKLNFAAVNDMPFKSIGDQLKARGIRPEGGFSSEGVWQHLKKNPALAKDVIYKNPRYVYFYVSVPPDVVGKLGTPLSKIRSIAMDDSIYTIGLPVYVNSNLHTGEKFRRLMIAQDTGGAIRGWTRADIFFGTGDEAYKYAHGQHARGEMFILMPKVVSY